MRKGHTQRVAVTFLIALVTASLLVGAAGGPVAAAGQPPLRGSFVAVETRTPDLPCGGLQITADGSGSATQLGSFGVQFDECVSFVEEPGRVHVDGASVLTAANGDELHIEYALEGGPPDPVTGAVYAEGPFTVTGGTGRFAQAAGGGIFVADTNVLSDVVTVAFDGALRRR